VPRVVRNGFVVVAGVVVAVVMGVVVVAIVVLGVVMEPVAAEEPPFIRVVVGRMVAAVVAEPPFIRVVVGVMVPAEPVAAEALVAPFMWAELIFAALPDVVRLKPDVVLVFMNAGFILTPFIDAMRPGLKVMLLNCTGFICGMLKWTWFM
jgi:hypothetical protein